MIKKKKFINDFDLSSQIYFKEISQYKSLSLDEEISLWKQYKYNNDIKARDKIIKSNLKFVASVAKKYQGRGLSYSDLIAEGNYGLLRAIDKFDYKKGYKTISYSVWWIKQAILEALKERNHLDSDELPNDFEKQHMEDDEIYEQAYHQHTLAGKTVNNKAAERTHEKRHKGIATQYKADSVLGRMERLAKVERE